jgi:3-hydroxyisobutyrate dehydrogenase-like beta-hydroxyacid dehydrogenase
VTVVGVVGLGAMGSRIVGRLLETGNVVHGTNRTKTRAGPLVARGMVWHDTPRDVAKTAEVVVSMVTDDDALEAIMSGQNGILAGLSVGKVHVDMSSVSPYATQRVAEQVRSVGARMLDAPVSGSVPQVERGELTIMVGGDEATYERVAALLRQLGQSVTRVGDNGSGVLLKIAINISLAVQTLAFSEGLQLAERGGIDPRLAADVMASSSIGSPMLKARLPLLLDLPDDAWFTIRLMHKDIRLALGAGTRLAVALPSAAAADDMLQQASDLGYADRDLASLNDVLAKISGGPAHAPTSGGVS